MSWSYINFFLIISGHKDCEYCGQSFSGPHASRNLEVHLKRHKRSSEVICQFCNKNYKEMSRLLKHQKTCKEKKINQKKKLSNIRSIHNKKGSGLIKSVKPSKSASKVAVVKE